MQADYAGQYAGLYHQHWWWRSRERYLLTQIRSLKLPEQFRSLDVGCGEGLLLPTLQAMGADPYGIEIDSSMLREDTPMRDRIFDRPLGDGMYRQKRYDLITALDVIEHIEDDHAAVDHMLAMLNPGGYLLLTVPAFPLLWDEHDEMNLHHRRYKLQTVRKLLAGRGQIIRSSYLFHGIFLPKLAVKAVNRVRGGEGKIAQHTLPSRWVNRVMETYCRVEQRILTPLQLPFGTSVFALLHKPHTQVQSVEVEYARTA